MTTSESLRRSYLIQRLERPYNVPKNHALAALDNVFSFGGGLKNGGLSDDAMGLLREVFRFDYMGAAEFEWGAVPEALSKIAQNADQMRGWCLTIPLADVEKPFHAPDELPEGKGTIYVISRAQDSSEITKRIKFWAKHPYGSSRNRDYSLKEPTYINHAMRPADDRDSDRCGWLELDNGFFFFTDREMWEKTARLFGVECDEPQVAVA